MEGVAPSGREDRRGLSEEAAAWLSPEWEKEPASPKARGGIFQTEETEGGRTNSGPLRISKEGGAARVWG